MRRTCHGCHRRPILDAGIYCAPCYDYIIRATLANAGTPTHAERLRRMDLARAHRLFI